MAAVWHHLFCQNQYLDLMDCNPLGSFCPWNSRGKNTGVGSHFFLQGIFPNQPNPGIKPGSPALQEDSLSSEPQGSPQTNINTFNYQYILFSWYLQSIWLITENLFQAFAYCWNELLFLKFSFIFFKIGPTLAHIFIFDTISLILTMKSEI